MSGSGGNADQVQAWCNIMMIQWVIELWKICSKNPYTLIAKPSKKALKAAAMRRRKALEVNPVVPVPKTSAAAKRKKDELPKDIGLI